MPENNHDATGQLEIRKYPNRRYYDTTRSQHVTLEEIYKLIRDGHEVRVTDSKTGADITGKILTQIILDLDSPKLDIFPAPMLHRLIRANEKLVSDFVEKYFNQALMAFLDSQRHFENYLRQAMGLRPPGASMPEWTQLMLNPFAMWGNRGKPPEGGTQENPPAEAPNVAQTVEELRQQVSELQKELAAKKKRSTGR
jgi:polyhydroxyalkanoate synthesis repressor PhaR